MVSAPVSRFAEPAALLALRGGESHGYDLAEAVATIAGAERVDYGNLYRLLRRLEAEDLVESEWKHDEPGRDKRTYRITEEGDDLLGAWAEALRETQRRISGFLDRYDERTS